MEHPDENVINVYTLLRKVPNASRYCILQFKKKLLLILSVLRVNRGGGGCNIITSNTLYRFQFTLHQLACVIIKKNVTGPTTVKFLFHVIKMIDYLPGPAVRNTLVSTDNPWTPRIGSFPTNLT